MGHYIAAMSLPMKSMKAMKSMKVMRAKKISMIAKGKLAKSLVFRGTKTKTLSGLTKDMLMLNKRGKVVSKARSAASKKRYAASKVKTWIQSVTTARKQMGITGFCPVNGKSAQGKALYAKAKSLLNA